MTRSNDRLTGWKEIAGYLRKDVRTVLRWERERGLPVHRPPGRRGQSVYAIPEELDRWIQSPGQPPASPVPDAPRALRTYVKWLTVPIALLLIAAAAFAARPRGVVQRVAIADRAVRAYDHGGRELWNYPLDGHVATPSVENGVGRTTHVGDVDGDGAVDAIVSVVSTRQAPDSVRALVLCFDANGAVKWVQEFDDEIQFRGRRFTGPWPGADLLVTGEPENRVLITAHHYTWSPALVVALDARTGARLARYEHDGWLMRIDITKDGRSIVAAGIAGHDEHAVAVLDARDLTQQSYFRLPRPDASAAAGQPLDRQYYAISQAVMPTVRFGHARSADPSPETIVELSADLRSAAITQSDAFFDWHRRLEDEGKLSHPARECPHRLTVQATGEGPRSARR